MGHISKTYPNVVFIAALQNLRRYQYWILGLQATKLIPNMEFVTSLNAGSRLIINIY